MRIKFLLITLSIFLFSINNISAQTDNSIYFDDGGISTAKNIIKINAMSIVQGDLPICYERVLNNSFSIEVAAGLILPYYVKGMLELMDDNPVEIEPTGGYSLLIHPKCYVDNSAPEYGYIGFQYRKRHFEVADGQPVVFSDITLNYGVNWILAKRLVIDYNIGLGLRYINGEVQNNESDMPLNIAIPIGIKVGLIF